MEQEQWARVAERLGIDALDLIAALAGESLGGGEDPSVAARSADGYRLLRYAEVLSELARAAELSADAIPLSERAARRAQPEPTALSARVRRRIASAPPEKRLAIVCEVVEEATASPARDTRGQIDGAGRAARALIALERETGDPQALPRGLAGALAAHLGGNTAAHERWADYLADASAALRRRSGTNVAARRRHRASRQRVLPTSSAWGASQGLNRQLELWSAELLDAEEGR